MRRIKDRVSATTVIALVALFVALGGAGIAANGQGLILGQPNSATSSTSLGAPVAGGKTLQLTNNDNTNPSSTALGLSVASGHAPFVVNSKAKVTNLNADLIDDQSGPFVTAGTVRLIDPLVMPGTLATSFKTLATVGSLEFVLGCTADAGINIAGLWIRSKAAHAAYAAVTSNFQGPLNYRNPDMAANVRYDLSGSGAPGFEAVSGEALTADGRRVSFSLHVGDDVGTTTNHSCLGGGSLIVR